MPPHLYQHLKRFLDVVGAALGLLLGLPIVALSAISVALTMGRPILYCQSRAGFQEEIFTLYKFRTMQDLRDETGRLLPDAPRLTAIGRLLRKLSLDELPQLWNVLRGNMTLVGPRPLLPEYLPRYSQFQRRRHEVKPGITGWAQVSGRNALSWERKFELDVWYVDNGSLCLDLKILWLTLLKVLNPEGIAQEGHATMPEFLGSVENRPRE